MKSGIGVHIPHLPQPNLAGKWQSWRRVSSLGSWAPPMIYCWNSGTGSVVYLSPLGFRVLDREGRPRLEGLEFGQGNAQEGKLIGCKLKAIYISLSWRVTPGVTLCDCHGPLAGVSRAGSTFQSRFRGRQGMAPHLPFSILRFPGFELIQSYQFLCMTGNIVPQALHILASEELQWFTWLPHEESYILETT